MKKYRVNVDGEEFEVTIEEIEENQLKTSVEKKEDTESVTIDENDEKTSNSTETSDTSKVEELEGEKIVAALPGTITSIEVSEGDQVEKGDVLFIHEAMKMENEITTPVSGTVKSIAITEGTDVDTDEVLAVIV